MPTFTTNNMNKSQSIKKIFLKTYEEIKTTILYIPRAFCLVWQAGPLIMLLLMLNNFLFSLLPISILWMTKLIIDAITTIVNSNQEVTSLKNIFILITLMGFLWLLREFLGVLTTSLTNLLRFNVQQNTQILIMKKCCDLDIAFFENAKNLDMLENATKGAMTSAWSLISLLLSIVSSLVMLIGYLIILTRLHWGIILIIIITTTPQMITASYFAKKRWFMNNNRAEDSRLRFYITWLMSQRDSVKEIRIFNLLDIMVERFKYFCKKFIKQEQAFTIKKSLADALLAFFSITAAIFIWIYIVIKAVAGVITIGDVVLYTQAVTNCQNSLINLFSRGGNLYEQVLFLGNLFTLLDIKPTSIEGALTGINGKKTQWGTSKVSSIIKKGIEFKNVSFRYPGTHKYIFRNINFYLDPYDSVALVGRNGAGKTTLIKLLVRLYDPTEGEIYFDGKNIKEYEISNLRQCFGVIFQDFIRYNLTARENIGFGQVEYLYSLDRIQSVARKAKAHSFISKLPEDYNTYLGKQFSGIGTDISLGEWQKIALARAYMRESPILILDEPTASLDAFSEYEIYNAFSRLTNDKLSIIISHRFSTVKMAKHIIVIDDGSIVEEGNHESLLAQKKLYSEMFHLQAQRYQ